MLLDERLRPDDARLLLEDRLLLLDERLRPDDALLLPWLARATEPPALFAALPMALLMELPDERLPGERFPDELEVPLLPGTGAFLAMPELDDLLELVVPEGPNIPPQPRRRRGRS